MTVAEKTHDFDQITKRITLLALDRELRAANRDGHIPWRGVLTTEKREGADTSLLLECGHHEPWPAFGDPPIATKCTTCDPPYGEPPALADELRNLWNARGAADIATIKERDRLDLDSEEICADAIRGLDR